MKNRIILTPIIFLTLLFYCQCTVEKRLYNRGFHVERKCGSSSFDKLSFRLQSDSIAGTTGTTNELVEEITIPPLTGVGGGSHTTYGTGSDLPESDTLTVQLENSSLKNHHRERITQLEKREGLIASGVATLAFGLGAVGVIHLAVTSTTAGLIFLLGPVGLILGIVAVFFFLLFLVYLCLPTEVSREDRVARSGIKEHKFSRGERAGLIVAMIFATSIAVAFFFSLTNN